MSIFVSEFAEWLILITGIINLITALFLFFTCRLVPQLNLTSRWMKISWYVSLYKYHSYAWWLFVPSLIVHVVFAISHLLSEG